MSTLNVANVTDGTTTVSTSYVVNGSARAWVKFSESTGVFAETFNTSSTTDNGSGDISYGLTSGMSNSDFPASGEAGGNFSSFFSRIISHAGSTSTSVRVRATNSSTYTLSGAFRFCSIIHGDLA